MIRSIAILTAMVGFAVPASAQMSQLGGGLPEIHQSQGDVEHSRAYADCDRRYRSMLARNDMRPSDRQGALASCRAAADLQVWKQQLAKTGR